MCFDHQIPFIYVICFTGFDCDDVLWICVFFTVYCFVNTGYFGAKVKCTYDPYRKDYTAVATRSQNKHLLDKCCSKSLTTNISACRPLKWFHYVINNFERNSFLTEHHNVHKNSLTAFHLTVKKTFSNKKILITRDVAGGRVWNSGEFRVFLS